MTNIRTLTLVACVGFCTLIAGCYEPVGPARAMVGAATPKPSLPPPTPQHVSVESRWAYSAEENRPSVDWLLENARRSSQLNEAKLNGLVGMWPDVTLDLLRDSIGRQTDLPLRLVIAQSYDRLFAASNASAGWSVALTIAASQREVYEPFRDARDRAMALLQDGKVAEAEKTISPSILPPNAPDALLAEKLRVAGLAALLREDAQRAASLFQKAASLLANGPRHNQLDLRLDWTEALRRCEKSASANNAWQDAVQMAALGGVRDPELWERAILAKPAGVPWPAQAASTLRDEEDFRNMDADEADVLLGIGKWRLERGAFQQSLLAFSQAEAETSVAAKKALARLYRVQCMIALQQPASALPMLQEIESFEDRRISLRASALRGEILCRVLNDREHGIPLMKQSLTAVNLRHWPEKDRLMANLGLYELLENNEADGLMFLHEAQGNFASRSQWEDLTISLKNEAAFFRATGKSTEAEIVQKRADEMARKAGLPSGPLSRATINRDAIFVAGRASHRDQLAQGCKRRIHRWRAIEIAAC